MFSHHLKSALRNLCQGKFYTLINITGLAVASAVCILLVLYIQHELSFDSFNVNANRIGRIVEQYQNTAGYSRLRPYTGTPLASLVKEELSSVKRAVRVSPESGLMRYQTKRFREERVLFVDSDLFTVFTFPLVEGDPATALTRPNSVVITPETAHKYFGDEPPLGKSLIFENGLDLTVTGVVAKAPQNSTLQYDFLGSFVTLDRIRQGWTEHWEAPVATYVLLQEGASFESVEQQIQALGQKHRRQEGVRITYSLESLRSIHIVWAKVGERLLVLGVIAAVMLAIAIINYSNLTTARLLRQTKAIGLRRALGAERKQIIAMMLGESLVVAAIAGLLAMTVIEIVQPMLAARSGIDFVGLRIADWSTTAWIILIVATAGILGGLYPALSFSAGAVKLGKAYNGVSGPGRSIVWDVLLVFQFCAAAVLLTVGIGAGRQYDYMLEKDLGFGASNIVVVPMDDQGNQPRLAALKYGLMRCPGVVSVGAASKSLAESDCNGLYFRVNESGDLRNVSVLWVDQDYIKTLGLSVTDGRDFADSTGTANSSCFVVNESARDFLGLGSLGTQYLQAFGSESGDEAPWYQGNVAGVVRDFHFRDLHSTLQPLIMIYEPRRCTFLLVRITPGDPGTTLAAMEKVWTGIVPSRLFEVSFLADDLKRQYRDEAGSAFLFHSASWLAIIVACLGLLGLAALSAELRVKEVGIRKVLGSSVSGILVLIGRRYILLVGIANLLACPIAFIVLRMWLSDFVYRVGVGPDLFLLTAVITVGVAVLAVGTQALHAARVNPVKSLRYE